MKQAEKGSQEDSSTGYMLLVVLLHVLRRSSSHLEAVKLYVRSELSTSTQGRSAQPSSLPRLSRLPELPAYRDSTKNTSSAV